jgi:TonB family protein
MTESVTDIIVARRRQPQRLKPMLLWSIAVHAGVVLFVLFGPMDWGLVAEEPLRTVMRISLAGAPGPPSGGATPMGGRAIPDPPIETPRAVAPPPPTPPRRVIPTETPARPQPRPAQTEEPRPGVTRTETGARGQGFGLATGGGGGSGVELDVTNFCCPEYLQEMIALIQQNWDKDQGLTGATGMKFTITRGGTIEAVGVARPSGFLALDLAAERALLRTRLPELPPQFPNPTLTVQATFEYQR